MYPNYFAGSHLFTAQKPVLLAIALNLPKAPHFESVKKYHTSIAIEVSIHIIHKLSLALNYY